MIDAVGNTIGVYDDARLDDLVHGVNATVLSSLFGAVISPHVRSRTTATLATLAFGVCGELLWELMEYIGQAIGFKGMMLSKDDTDGDIAAAFIGTAVAAAITWIRWRPSAERPLVDWEARGSDRRAEVASRRERWSGRRSGREQSRTRPADAGRRPLGRRGA